jgi:hypothetical protein
MPSPARSLDAYRRYLADAPPQGSGRGNSWLLGAARRAQFAEVPVHEAVCDIHDARPWRSLAEVRRAVLKAFDGAPLAPMPRVVCRAPLIDADTVYAQALTRFPEPIPQLIESSPIRLLNDITQDAALLLECLFRPEEYIFIGEKTAAQRLGGNVRRVDEWLPYIRSGGQLGTFLGTNPLSGTTGTTSEGKPTLRGNNCVTAWRYMIMESDLVPPEAQAALWMTYRLPVAAIVHSANKSLHCWLRVENDTDRQRLKRLFAPLLMDPQCWHPGRLSRTPGVLRTDKIEPGVLPEDNYQLLLYLDPDAKGIAI